MNQEGPAKSFLESGIELERCREKGRADLIKLLKLLKTEFPGAKNGKLK